MMILVPRLIASQQLKLRLKQEMCLGTELMLSLPGSC